MRGAGINVALTDVWGRGGAGGSLAKEVIRLSGRHHEFAMTQSAYQEDRRQLQPGCTVRTSGVCSKALKEMKNLSLGYGNLPVCMAKTQYSRIMPKLLGRPRALKYP